jgi:hypothetical protein
MELNAFALARVRMRKQFCMFRVFYRVEPHIRCLHILIMRQPLVAIYLLEVSDSHDPLSLLF